MHKKEIESMLFPFLPLRKQKIINIYSYHPPITRDTYCTNKQAFYYWYLVFIKSRLARSNRETFIYWNDRLKISIYTYYISIQIESTHAEQSQVALDRFSNTRIGNKYKLNWAELNWTELSWTQLNWTWASQGLITLPDFPIEIKPWRTFHSYHSS